MNLELLSALARDHREQMLREAELLRLVRRHRPDRDHFLCGHVVRILRSFGDACYRSVTRSRTHRMRVNSDFGKAVSRARKT